VLREISRPVVVVPPAPADGSGILVAYGGGREVARALQALVLLGLAKDETVDLLAVHRDRDIATRRLRQHAEFLTAHDVAHRTYPIVSDDTPASVILTEIGRRGRDSWSSAHPVVIPCATSS